jgi:hypothetical protein
VAIRAIVFAGGSGNHEYGTCSFNGRFFDRRSAGERPDCDVARASSVTDIRDDDRPGVDRCLPVHGPREDFRSSPSSIEMSLPSKICVAVISMLLECKPLRVA